MVGRSGEHIAVVSGFRLQLLLLRKSLRNVGSGIEVVPVESIQGREKHVVIVSTVRTRANLLAAQSDKRHELGFMFHEGRLNTAITRAASMLLLVGDEVVLAQDPHWNKLLKILREKGALRPATEAGEDVPTPPVITPTPTVRSTPPVRSHIAPVGAPVDAADSGAAPGPAVTSPKTVAAAPSEPGTKTSAAPAPIHPTPVPDYTGQLFSPAQPADTHRFGGVIGFPAEDTAAPPPLSQQPSLGTIGSGTAAAAASQPFSMFTAPAAMNTRPEVGEEKRMLYPPMPAAHLPWISCLGDADPFFDVTVSPEKVITVTVCTYGFDATFSVLPQTTASKAPDAVLNLVHNRPGFRPAAYPSSWLLGRGELHAAPSPLKMQLYITPPMMYYAPQLVVRGGGDLTIIMNPLQVPAHR